MFSLLSGFITWLFSKDELKVLMVGLDYAGKTTLLERIKHAYAPAYRGIALDAIPPTIGMNLAKVATQRVEVTFWDVGGAVSECGWGSVFSAVGARGRGRASGAPTAVRARSPRTLRRHRRRR